MAEGIEEEKWDVEETEEPESDEQDVITYEISYYPADLTLKGYLDKWDSKQLKIPPFQRSYVWDQVKASKLIESFLLGLPVPGVFLYRERSTNKLQVIDGQQRILSAIRFFKNEFDEKIFRLKKVQSKWEGRTYAELTEADRYLLDDTVLRATVVQQLDPEDYSSVYHVFERLNTGGINLNPMEIRKCVYFGKVFSLLESLNEIQEWRVLIGKPKLDKRLRDVEMVLRVLSLTESREDYSKPMKGFLNNFMTTKNRLPEAALDAFIESTKNEFSASCKYAIAELGERPFHLRGRLNYAVMDSVMAVMPVAAKMGIKNMQDRYQHLLKDDDYIENVTRSTSDEKALTIRFLRATEFLLG